MLQQTQVDRVHPEVPPVPPPLPHHEALAAAPVDDVRQPLVPARLQHPSRAAARDRAARRSRVTTAGSPTTADSLRALPGIGRYTAGASSPSRYGRDVAVLDTNVRRVLARVFLGPRRVARLRGEQGAVGPRGAPGARGPRLRLQPGAHGLRRHLVHAAASALSRLPDARVLRHAHRVTPADHRTGRRRARPGRGRPLPRSPVGARASIWRASGSSPAASGRRTRRSRRRCAASSRRSSARRSRSAVSWRRCAGVSRAHRRAALLSLPRGARERSRRARGS